MSWNCKNTVKTNQKVQPSDQNSDFIAHYITSKYLQAGVCPNLSTCMHDKTIMAIHITATKVPSAKLPTTLQDIIYTM